MAYIGQSIKNGTFSVLDTSGNTYNGSNTTFNLGTQVGSPAQLLVSHDGVIQKPGTDYTLASGGTQITFTTAPASGASIFIVEISGAVGGPMNRDINGDELILDVDGDTSITADTDDQIDIKIGGTDQFSIKDGVIEPTTDNDVDIGSTSKEFKDAFFDGTVTTDALTVGSTSISANGITNAQLWRVTADQTGDQTPLSGVFEQPDTGGQGYIGSVMSESSGTWTFPTTGIWLIRFTAMFENTTRNDRLCNVLIKSTTDNSTYDNSAFSYTGIEQNTYATGVATLLFDVTNTTTHKVRFHTENIDSATRTLGHTGVNLTHITFVRLGDT